MSLTQKEIEDILARHDAEIKELERIIEEQDN